VTTFYKDFSSKMVVWRSGKTLKKAKALGKSVWCLNV